MSKNIKRVLLLFALIMVISFLFSWNKSNAYYIAITGTYRASSFDVEFETTSPGWAYLYYNWYVVCCRYGYTLRNIVAANLSNCSVVDTVSPRYAYVLAQSSGYCSYYSDNYEYNAFQLAWWMMSKDSNNLRKPVSVFL